MKKIFSVAMLITLAAATCYANDVIKALDVDKDNLVNLEEAKILPELLAQFESLDQNKDHMLDAKEILEYRKPQ